MRSWSTSLCRPADSLDMARQPRLIVADQLHLVWQCGLGVPPLFQDELDYRNYLNLLWRWAKTHRVDVHAHVLLPDQVVLLVTPHALPSPAPLACGLSALMQALGRDHVAAYNRRHSRGGTLWQGRFRAAPVEATHWRACVQYIEQAPVRQSGVSTPGDYLWSSARHHLGLERLDSLKAHPQHWTLGNTPFEREAGHRQLLAEPLGSHLLSDIERTPRQGWAWGSAGFLLSLQGDAGSRRLRPAARGRPRKA